LVKKFINSRPPVNIYTDGTLPDEEKINDNFGLKEKAIREEEIETV